MKTQLVVIQPTSLCNINCRYCYLPYRSVNKRMSMETLSQISKRLFSSPFVSDKLTIVWHAGEPLILPPSFYEEAFQILQQWNTKGVHVTHSFQTNGTLITQQWCDFFKKHAIQIGVSIDGPKYIHDANRVDWAGKGTFDRVLHGLTLLRENQQPFSIIAVVTRDSVDQADNFWRFFKEIGPTHLGLNPEEADGANKQSSLETNEDIHAYQRFFARILELTAQEPLLIRESASLMTSIKVGSLLSRTQTNVPMTIISFDSEGNISTFCPELLTITHATYGNFIFGNVFQDTLEDILKKPKFIAVNQEIQQGVLKCLKSCPYFMFCGGGHPSNKLSENGTFNSTETRACQLRVKAATDAMVGHLEKQYHIQPTSRG
jgi:uncharacterized protein